MNYDEAIEELLKTTWNGNPLNYPTKTIKALERAKKEHELLGLFKQLSLVNYNMAITRGGEDYYENKRAILIKKIIALEEELK